MAVNLYRYLRRYGAACFVYALVLITWYRQGNYSITILAAYLAQIPSVLDGLRRNELYGQVDDRDAEALAEEDVVALNGATHEDIRSSDRVRPRNSLLCTSLTSGEGHHSYCR
jgi:hypothetical protein